MAGQNTHWEVGKNVSPGLRHFLYTSGRKALAGDGEMKVWIPGNEPEKCVRYS